MTQHRHPIARIYARDTFAHGTFAYEGDICCGGCDLPVVGISCAACCIVFAGDRPEIPVPTFGDRRQAWHDAHSYEPLVYVERISPTRIGA